MARKPTIADVLGFGGVPKRDLTQGFRREISKIKPGQKLQGSISRARPTAAQELAQLLTPDTRFGAQLAEKIAPAVDMSPLGLLTGLVDARRQYQAGNTGTSAATGLLAALGAVPGGKGVSVPLSKKDFIKNYMQHIDLRGRSGNADEVSKKIIEEGFAPGFGPNLLPVWMGGNPKNIMEQKFLPKSGDTVYLVPKAGQKKTSSGAYRISEGWKPEGFEIIKIPDDFSDVYTEYLKAFDKNG